MIFIVINLTLLLLSGVNSENQKNVCKNFNDYANIQRSLNCWYDPDVYAPPSQLAKNHGLPFETHEVITEDGYVLALWRIPHNGSDPDREKIPLILQHGFLTDAVYFMMNGEESPAFILSNKGFDVWLPNVRGTKHSKKHLKHSPKNREFWNFSFHEMGVFDLPAIIDFVAKKTRQRGKITYVGHSMGTTMFFIYSSIRPSHAAENIKRMIALAPVAFMSHLRSILVYGKPFQLQEALHIYSIGQSEISFLANICSKYPGLLPCYIGIAFASGFNFGALKFKTLPVFFTQIISGTSLKTYEHFAQLFEVGKGFAYFDYGPENNIKLYNSSVVPQYNLSQIRVPVNLFYGRKDFLSEESDVLQLYEKLATKKSITRVLPSANVEFSHQDFVVGIHVKALYDLVVEKM